MTALISTCPAPAMPCPYRGRGIQPIREEPGKAVTVDRRRLDGSHTSILRHHNAAGSHGVGGDRQSLEATVPVGKEALVPAVGEQLLG